MLSPKEEIPSRHWADTAADELIRLHPEKDEFVCASGISPSGVVHIGNFREVITVDFVVRCLRERGKKVRFIYSWDDYDALRKVPANLPNTDTLSQHLRKPLSKVPDPYGREKSYAQQFENRFEKEIEQLGIFPNYIRQNERYRANAYTQGIKDALENEKTIIEILNRARTEPLPPQWTCVSIFCSQCDRDTTELIAYVRPTTLHYRCKACKKELSLDFAKEEGAKLLWRIDWPMRWAHEKVDFEPGGKDHSSQGGSFDTGKEIIQTVWKRPAPYYVQYDFVLAKGLGSKLSSSSGNLITLGEALEIYEPQVIRWLFASRKPNLDFSIAFDLDVIKAYEDFDRTERYAFGAEAGEEKKLTYERRIYELSCTEPTQPAGSLPTQFPFRHLCNLLQIYQGDLEKTAHAFGVTAENRKRFEARATRAWKWITQFAPTEFRFSLKEPGHRKTSMPEAVRGVVTLLRDPAVQALTEDELANRIFQVMKGCGLESKAFFQEIYGILIDKPHGPKLASFLRAIGPMKAATLLEKSL